MTKMSTWLWRSLLPVDVIWDYRCRGINCSSLPKYYFAVKSYSTSTHVLKISNLLFDFICMADLTVLCAGVVGGMRGLSDLHYPQRPDKALHIVGKITVHPQPQQTSLLEGNLLDLARLVHLSTPTIGHWIIKRIITWFYRENFKWENNKKPDILAGNVMQSFC